MLVQVWSCKDAAVVIRRSDNEVVVLVGVAVRRIWRHDDFFNRHVDDLLVFYRLLILV